MWVPAQLVTGKADALHQIGRAGASFGDPVLGLGKNLWLDPAGAGAADLFSDHESGSLEHG